jgi:hypothetical protein
MREDNAPVTLPGVGDSGRRPLWANAHPQGP